MRIYKRIITISLITGMMASVLACGTIGDLLPETTVAPEPETGAAVVAEPSPVVEGKPTATPEPQPTAIEVPTETSNTVLLDYGFGLRLDGKVPLQFAGWSEESATVEQGLISFPYEGVSAMLSWFPAVVAPQQTVADGYGRLRDAQPALTFEGISDGPIEISGAQGGLFGGFRVLDPAGTAVGGGFVAGWICPQNATTYALQVTGPDATVVQIRFQRLVSYFRCLTPVTEEAAPES
jgi:hypothetical protein